MDAKHKNSEAIELSDATLAESLLVDSSIMPLVEHFYAITGVEMIEAVLKKSVCDKVASTLTGMTPERIHATIVGAATKAEEFETTLRTYEARGTYYTGLEEGCVLANLEEIRNAYNLPPVNTITEATSRISWADATEAVLSEKAILFATVHFTDREKIVAKVQRGSREEVCLDELNLNVGDDGKRPDADKLPKFNLEVVKKYNLRLLKLRMNTTGKHKEVSDNTGEGYQIGACFDSNA
eukprot:3765901-Amphidinium_carterae.1